jgi:hypothetical protein
MIQYYIARGDDVTTRSIYVDGAWQMNALATHPFYVGFGDNFGFKNLTLETDQLFPLQVWCRDESQDLMIRLVVMPKHKDHKWDNSTGFTFSNLSVVSGQVRTRDFAANISDGMGFLSRNLSVPALHIPPDIFSRAVSNLLHCCASRKRNQPTIWFVGQMSSGYELRGVVENACGPGPFLLTVYRVGQSITSMRGKLIIQTWIRSQHTDTNYPAAYDVQTQDGGNYHFEPLQKSFNFDVNMIEFFNCGSAVTGTESGLGFQGAQNFVDETKILRRILVQLGFVNIEELLPYYMVGPPTAGVIIASFLFFVFWISLIICICLIIKWNLKKPQSQ